MHVKKVLKKCSKCNAVSYSILTASRRIKFGNKEEDNFLTASIFWLDIPFTL